MTDIRIANVVSDEAVTLDLLMTPAGTFDISNELATAVTVALGTDARAKDDDELPDPDSDDRRGWWADTEAEQIWGAWPIGSRLWILERTKITGPEARAGSTVAKVERYLREALSPLRTNRIVSRIAVTAAREGVEGVSGTVTLYRGPQQAIDLRFQVLWDAQVAPPSDLSAAPDFTDLLPLGVL